MSRRDKVVIVFVPAAIAGFFASFIEWHPSSNVDATGFPIPLGIVVRLDDGSTDCGSGIAGLWLNPLLFMFGTSLLWAGFVLVRRMTANRRAA